jgi:hypothetical protein
LPVLRDRGVLERAVRRQLVHLLADSVLNERPAWVREGAAIHFSEGESAPSARAVCPQDAEITRPVSVGAFGDASRRARVCFERQLAARKDWRVACVLLVTVLYYLVPGTSAHTEIRYVLPMHGVLIVFAGAAISYLFELIPKRSVEIRG